MRTETQHEQLQSLRIDDALRNGGKGPRLSWKRLAVGLLVILILAATGVFAYRIFAPAAAEVEVVAAKAEGSGGAWGAVLSASGYIVPHHKLDVNSKVTGRVEWIGVEKGDTVKEGQVLVRLENQEFRSQLDQAEGAVQSAGARLLEAERGSRPEEIAQAQANLAEVRATAKDDQSTLERTRQLFAAQIVSRQSLDDAVAKYDASQRRADSFEQALRLAQLGPRAEEVQRAKGELLEAEGQRGYAASELEATIIRAPVSGTILERTAEKGELVTAQFASAAEGGPRGSVVALADLADLQVELDIAQEDFAKLSPRQQAIVTVDAFKDRRYRGEISEMSPEANRQKATVQIKVRILNPDSYLRPEMNATVQFLPKEGAAESKSAVPGYVLIPSAGLREQDGRRYVLLAIAGKAVRRTVRVMNQRPGGYLVDSLTAGEGVITNGPPDLRDGQAIHIKGQP